MYTGQSSSPPLHMIQNQISRYSKRLAIIQAVQGASLITLIGLLYLVIDDLLLLLEITPDDMEAMQIALMEIIDANQTVFSILTITMIVALVSSIMYLISFFRVAKGFLLLARILPIVANPALKAGNFIRYALFIQIASVIFGSIAVTSISYIMQIISIVGYGLLIAAYHNLSLVFRSLYENSLYPKRESRLLLYSQILPAAAMIPLIFPIMDLFTGQEIRLIPLILGGTILVLGYVGLLIGFFNLSKDVLLIKQPVETEYEQETGIVYQPSRFYQPEKKPVKSYEEKIIPPSEIDDSDMTAQYCSNCGTKLKPDKQFCHGCGMKVEDL